MGITGLLPFLEKSSRRTNIKEFAGGSVAIDSYCWLHKGIFSCAEKISIGQPTDAYVVYCMKFINMLLKHNIKPILVFDGRHLPAKAATESKRRENREMKRRRAADLIRSGQTAEGRNLLRQSLDVTHEIALELIKTCQSLNIDCIVAPYEADAQLAYLNISGIADVVITEDSDLTLFGCKRVFFKMDVTGNGLLVEQDKLHLAMDVKSADFDMNKFLYMCILSGCDYLPSLRGIGLSKAKKFISMNSDCDIHRALTNLGTCLNMRSLAVSKEYRDDFIKAFVTFKHQLVFCPIQRKQVRLNPPTADVTGEQLHYAGEEIDDVDKALQLAYGNCDPFTFKQLHDFNPDKKKNCNKINPKMLNMVTKHISIWSNDYKLNQNTSNRFTEKIAKYEHQLLTKKLDTSGQRVNLQTSSVKRTSSLKKEEFSDINPSNYEGLSEKDILETYKSEEKVEKNDDEKLVEEENLRSSSVDEQTSPVLTRKTNPFAKETLNTEISPSLLFKRKNRIKLGFLQQSRKTIIDGNVITESKFFTHANEHKNIDNNAVDNDNGINSTFNESQIYHCAKKMRIEDLNDITNNLHDSIKINSDNAHSINLDQLDQNMLINGDQNMSVNENQNMSINIDQNMSINENQNMSINIDQNMSINKDQDIVSENIIEETITQQHIHCLDHVNESTNLFNSKNELQSIKSNVNRNMDTYNCDMSHSCSPTSESDYSVSQNSIEDNRRDLFRFSYVKLNTFNDTKPSKAIERRLSNSQMEIRSKSTSKRGNRNKQLPSERGQRNLLSMYGFQKKENLRP